MKPERVANFINNSRMAQNILKGINKNPALCGAGSAFIFASIMRPSLIEAIPFKEEKDKRYSQASSIAAGVVDLAATAAIFIPLNKSINKSTKMLTADVFQNSKAVEQYKSLTNRGLKTIALVPISLARFSIVRPIVDFLFGKEDEPNGGLINKMKRRFGK